ENPILDRAIEPGEGAVELAEPDAEIGDHRGTSQALRAVAFHPFQPARRLPPIAGPQGAHRLEPGRRQWIVERADMSLMRLLRQLRLTVELIALGQQEMRRAEAGLHVEQQSQLPDRRFVSLLEEQHPGMAEAQLQVER